MANICFMQAFLAWTMCLVWIGQTFPQAVQRSIRFYLVCFLCAVAFSFHLWKFSCLFEPHSQTANCSQYIQQWILLVSRSEQIELQHVGWLLQVDGSAWMAFYAICMLRMAVELSLDNNSLKSLYEDQAVIYLKHFCRIKKSLNDINTGDNCHISAYHSCLVHSDVSSNDTGTFT